MSGERFGGVVRWAVRRSSLVLAVVGVLALAGAALALRLDPSASTDTLVERSSESFEATERFNREFGDDPVLILVKGNLQRTVLTSDLGRVIGLEGCIAGNAPKEALKALPPVCTAIAERKFAKVVYGPGTFVNTAAGQIQEGFTAQRDAKARQAEQAARAARRLAIRKGLSRARQRQLAESARQLVYGQFVRESLQLALRYGLTSLPRIDDPDFVSQLVFDSKRGVGQPKARFAYLFPSKDSALIQVRLKPNLSESQRDEAIALIREATSEPRFKPQRGARYVVTGVPVVVDGLASAVQTAIFVLLAAALLVMAGTLAVVFRSQLRLLPLALALAAAALTFGAVSLAGGELTMASIAALPVLIGLAVDYAIQFHARFGERRWASEGEPRPESAIAAASAGGPTIAAAGISTAVGFLVLLFSPVPMVRGFGVLLVLGIVLAFACTLTAGFAALVRYWDRPGRPDDVPPFAPRLRAFGVRAWERVRYSRPGGWAADVWERAVDLALGIFDRARDAGSRGVDLAIVRPRKVLAVGLLLAVIGFAVDTQTEVISDVRELVPQDLQALKDVNTLQESTGVSGEIDVTVKARDLTDPKVIEWMSRFQQSVLDAHGYKPGSTCAQEKNPPELCPALSLPDLFRTTQARDQKQIRALLDAVPPYFSQAVIAPDRKTANLAFGIRLMPLDRQAEVVKDIKRRLEPPEGVTASVVGLPVLAAEANDSLSSPLRRALTLAAALLLVFLVLLLIRRRARLAAVPLIPIAMATGWSSLTLFLLRIPLNPMSVTLGALVLAIATEFSVLLSSRYEEERRAGAAPEDALDRTYASTGSAVLASGATAIAGFAALIASDIRMLRDFGIVTVVDLTVALLGVMVVLPAALIWAEDHGAFTLRDLDPRVWWRALREEFGPLPRPRLRMPRPGRPRMPRVRRPRMPRPRVPRPRLPRFRSARRREL